MFKNIFWHPVILFDFQELKATKIPSRLMCQLTPLKSNVSSLLFVCYKVMYVQEHLLFDILSFHLTFRSSKLPKFSLGRCISRRHLHWHRLGREVQRQQQLQERSVWNSELSKHLHRGSCYLQPVLCCSAIKCKGRFLIFTFNSFSIKCKGRFYISTSNWMLSNLISAIAS